MNTQKLSDLKPGDPIAFQSCCFRGWWSKVKVVKITDRCLMIDCERDTKFWRSSGAATSKEHEGYKVSVITPEIQEQWDRDKEKALILALLQKKENVTIDALKKAVVELMSQSECSKDTYIECIKQILFANTTSSACLTRVIELLSK